MNIDSRRKPASNIELVLAVLYSLGGDRDWIHTEHIAVACHKKYPQRFSWRLPEYAHFPDREPTRFALEDAKKRKNFYKGQPLVEGRSGKASVKHDYHGVVSQKDADGWRLTASGIAYLTDKNLLADSQALSSEPVSNRIASPLARAIRMTDVYKRFKSAGDLADATQNDLRDLVEFPRSGPDDGFRNAAIRFSSRLRRDSAQDLHKLSQAIMSWLDNHTTAEAES